MGFTLETEILSSLPDQADAPAGRVIPRDPDALLFQAEVAYLAAVSTRTLEAFRLHGGGPPYIVIGKRAVRYRRGDVIAWLDARRRRSTSDPGSGTGEPQGADPGDSQPDARGTAAPPAEPEASAQGRRGRRSGRRPDGEDRPERRR